MLLEAVLAYVHLLAVLSWVVFLSSSTALARAEWLNAAALQRLATVERVANLAALAVLASGLARMVWGAKGLAWYGAQPLLWAKLALFALMAAAAWRGHGQLRGWLAAHRASGALPPPEAVAAWRRRTMRAAHLMLVIPLAAVLLARGLLTR